MVMDSVALVLPEMLCEVEADEEVLGLGLRDVVVDGVTLTDIDGARLA